MEKLISVKISSQGQVTIPRGVREVLGLKPGERADLLVREEQKELALKPQPRSWAEYGLGLGREAYKGKDTEALLRRERDSWD